MNDYDLKDINKKFLQLGLPELFDSNHQLTEFGMNFLLVLGIGFAIKMFEYVIRNTLQR